MVVIALGGGPRTRLALKLAHAVASRVPDARVIAALGFVADDVESGLDRVTCIGSREGLADLLRQARVAVTAGGLTLAEAAACATPVVATAVVEAQRPTIRAFVARGAAIDGGRLGPAAIPALADAVADLMGDRRRCARMASAGRALVDGRGSARVARAVRAWLAGAPGRTS